ADKCNCCMAAFKSFSAEGSTLQKSHTSDGPISALQVNLVPAKRCNCRSRDACTRARFVFEFSLPFTLKYQGCITTFALQRTSLKQQIVKDIAVYSSSISET